MNKFNSTLKGFTLLELMIVVAVIGILASIAWPSYLNYVIKANRSAAQAEMMTIAGLEQQFLLSDRAYASKAILAASGFALPANVAAKYSYDVTADNSATPPTFVITFTPTGSQATDGILTLDQSGSKTPSDKW